MAMFHKSMKGHRHGRWKIRDTARYFGVSIGLVSENLKLMKQYGNLRRFKTRTDALEFYK